MWKNMRETNFKQSEIGLIPHDWEVKELGALFDFFAGGDVQKDDFSATQIGAKNNPIYSNSLENKGLYGYTSNPRYAANSITITGRGSLGHAEYRNHAFDAIVRLLVLQPKVKIDCAFVANEINYLVPFVFESTGVPQLTVPQAARAMIPLPPTTAEQERIADALSKIDNLITDLDALIEKKRAIKTGTMQQLLTGKKRLKGFTGKWKETKFDTIFTPISSRGKQIGTTEYKTNGTYPIIDQGQKDIVGYTTKNNPIICPDNGLIIFGDHTRIFKFTNYDFFVGADGTQILSVNGSYIGKFIYYLCLTLEIPNTGYNRHFKYLKEATFIIPPTIEEQNAIASILSSMDAEIAALEQKRDKYIAIKQGMMQNLLTGKIRLV